MNKQTMAILANLSGGSTELVIRGDSMLGNMSDEEKALLLNAISKAKKLESITLERDNLDDRGMGSYSPDDATHNLTTVFVSHPTLRKVFLRGNNFDSLTFADHLLSHNQNIAVLDISESQRVIEANKYIGFLNTAVRDERLVVLRLPAVKVVDKNFENILAQFASSKNLLEFSYPATMVGETDVLERIKSACDNNKKEVDKILEQIEKPADVKRSDIEAFNARIPAIFHLIEVEAGSERAAQILYVFHAKIQSQLGVRTHLEDYVARPKQMPEAPKPVAPPPKPKPIFDTTTIDRIAAELPTLPAEDLEAQIRSNRNLPSTLRELGKGLLATANKMPVAAIHIMTSEPTLEAPTQEFTDFLKKFKEACDIVNEIASANVSGEFNRAAQESFGSTAPMRNRPVVNFINKLFGVTPKVITLSDAAAIVREASDILDGISNKTELIYTGVDTQLQVTDKITDAYMQIDKSLQTLNIVCGKVLGEWRDEAGIDRTGIKEDDGTKEPIHIQTLAVRLDFLERTRRNIQESHANYVLHARFIQEQEQHLLIVVEQNLPLLSAAVSAFSSHLDTIARISGLDAQVAVKAIESVDKLAENTRQSFEIVSQDAVKIRGHVSYLFPSATVSPSVPVSIRGAVPDTGPQHV